MTAMNPGGPPARLIDGRFQLLDRLGGGGMGLVWRARDTALDREVALKEVRPPDLAVEAADPEGARQMRERVLREARALARLQHPNVVTIHHIVDSAEHPYPWLVMELVSGGSLADRLERGPLTVAEAAWVGRGVLSALRAAHAAGVQHRDVKPGNVLLRTAGAPQVGPQAVGTPVLTDFGIAAVQNSTALTATGALIGSPEYIAPERIRGREGDPSSDLWSLGMMLYVAVEGHHPLRRSTALATLAAVLDEPLPPPTRAGALSPLLSAILAKDPASRPDADDMDRMLATAELVGGGPTGPMAAPFPAPPYSGDAATGTAGPHPRHPAAGGTPGTPPPVPPYGGGQHTPHPAFGSGGQTPPHTSGQHTPPPQGGGLIPSAYGPHDQVPPGYGPAGYGPPHTPANHTAPHNRRSGAKAALAILSSTGTIAVVGFGVWALVPHNNHAGAHANPPTTLSSTGPAPLASKGTPSSAATDPATSGPAPAGTLLTPAGMRTVVNALGPYIHDSQVKDLTFYEDFASAEAPTPQNPKNVDDLTYRDGSVTHEPFDTLGPDDKVVNLKDYDWNVVPALLARAHKTLKVPKPTATYVIVEYDDFDEAPSLKVYLSDDYGSGYLDADLKGHVKRSYPKGD